MNLYEPVDNRDLTALAASRDALVDERNGTHDNYHWVGIGEPTRDPDDPMSGYATSVALGCRAERWL